MVWRVILASNIVPVVMGEVTGNVIGMRETEAGLC